MVRGPRIREYNRQDSLTLFCQSEFLLCPSPASAFRKRELTALPPVFLKGVAVPDCIHANVVKTEGVAIQCFKMSLQLRDYVFAPYPIETETEVSLFPEQRSEPRPCCDINGWAKWGARTDYAEAV
jgi:hypothetical protein